MKKISMGALFFLISTCAFSQYLLNLGVDISQFPEISQKFIAVDENGKQILSLSNNDFRVSENDIPRNILSVTCPKPKPPEALSSALVIDVSGSMRGGNIIMAKEAAKLWVSFMDLKVSECGIAAFSDRSTIIQPMTNSKNLLLEGIDKLFPWGGTDYNKAFLSGLILTRDRAKKRVIVMLTDGEPNSEPETQEIIEEAKKQNCVIYAVVLGMRCPMSLKDMADQTGGLWFERILTINEVLETYLRILSIEQGSEPCTLVWESGTKCNPFQTTSKIDLLPYNLKSEVTYTPPANAVESIETNPRMIFFKDVSPGESKDTTITVTAHNVNLVVDNIISSNTNFTISPTKFKLNNGESIELKITYTPVDSGYTYTEFSLQQNTSICRYDIVATGGFPGVKPKINTLKIIQPNGGEIFAVGNDTLIKWTGISPLDTVVIEYSFDDGNSWILLEENAVGNHYYWKNIPLPASSKCILRANQKANDYVSDSLPTLQWSKTYGGGGFDLAVSICPDFEGGFTVLSETSSKSGDVLNAKGYTCLWLFNTDTKGNMLWQKTYGNVSNLHPEKMITTSDGGYIIISSSNSKGNDVSQYFGDIDVWIIKTDYMGKLVWEKSFGNKGHDYPTDIIETSDGCFVIIANGSPSTNLMWIFKISADGDELWSKNYGSDNHSQPGSIMQTPDGGFIAVGAVRGIGKDVAVNKGGFDYFILKLNENGDKEWTKTYGGTSDDFATSVVMNNDGHYVVGGYTSSYSGDIDVNKGGIEIWIIGLDEQGNLVWQNTLGGKRDEYLHSMITNRKGEIVFVGSSNSIDIDLTVNKGMKDFWVVKTDDKANIIWQRSYGGSKDDEATAIAEALDGGYIVAGNTSSNDKDVKDNKGGPDVWLVKLSPDNYYLQSDDSDSLFAIVVPKGSATDVDMKQVYVGNVVDSVVINFIENQGLYKLEVDSIYFSGADANAFMLVSGIPPFEVASNTGKDVEFRFKPSRVGLHEAVINIQYNKQKITRRIIGEGIPPSLALETNFLDFGKVLVNNNKDILGVITVRNIGDNVANINDINISKLQTNGFQILSKIDNITLNPDDTLFLDFRFTPEKIGWFREVVQFVYDGIDSPLELHLYGEGYIDGGIGVTLRMLDDEAYPNDNIKTYLVVEHDNYFYLSGAESISTELHFNPTVLSPFDYEAEFIDDKNSLIRIDNLPAKFNTGDTIATIWFRVGLGNSENSQLKLSETKSDNDLSKINTIDGTVSLLGICYEGGARLINPYGTVGIMQISPNPTDKDIIVTVNLIEKSTTKLTIFNSVGIKCEEHIFEGEAGEKNVQINTSEYSNGLYYIHLQTPTIYEVKKFVVVK